MPPKDIIISIQNYACPTKPISFSITQKPNNLCDSVTSNSFSSFFRKKEFLLGLKCIDYLSSDEIIFKYL